MNEQVDGFKSGSGLIIICYIYNEGSGVNNVFYSFEVYYPIIHLSDTNRLGWVSKLSWWDIHAILLGSFGYPVRITMWNTSTRIFRNLVAFHKIILYTINASGDSAPRVWRLLSGNQAGLSSKICSSLTYHRNRTCSGNLVSTNSSSFQSSVHHFDPKKYSRAHPN